MNNNISPFLRWAGGKNWLVKYIDKYLPKKFIDYYELFLGGGAVFMHLLNKKLLINDIVLSDINFKLIETYKVVQNDLISLVQDLKRHKNTKEYYYKIRSVNFKDPIKKASQFIYLNRTSFNGIYRENLNGIYNVPYGYKQYAKLFDFENLNLVSNSIRSCYFQSIDFSEHYDSIKPKSLVFLDPPYTVAHGKNGFIKYNQKIYSWNDQLRLNEFVKQIDKKGAYFILTNANHESIRELYNSTGNIYTESRYSVVGGNHASRNKYSELIITNTK